MSEHFCHALFGPHPSKVKLALEARFGWPFNALYIEHGDGECLFTQRMDTKKIMRFYPDELKEWSSDVMERLFQRVMHRVENSIYDNYT